MKTRRPACGIGRRSRLARLLLPCVLLPILASPVGRAAEPGAPEAKDHTLFVGVDFLIPQDGADRKVTGAGNGFLQVEVDRRIKNIATEQLKGLHVRKGIKLSNLSATVSSLVKTKTNAAANLARAEAIQNSMGLSGVAEEHRERVLRDMTGRTMLPPGEGDASQRAVSAATAGGIADMEGVEPRIRQDNNLADDLVLKSQPNGLAGEFDGLEISFEVSAPQPLLNPYVILLTDCTVPGKGDRIFHKIASGTLDHIDAKPQKIKMTQFGFPPGTQLKGCRVHIYAQGQEVATNQSERRLAVTKEEAYQFMVIEYLAAHAGETRAPTPVLMIPGAEFARRVGAAQLDQTIYAKVSRTGKTLELSTDAAGSGRIPAEMQSALQELRFIPALEKGKPIDGHAQVRLADLAS